MASGTEDEADEPLAAASANGRGERAVVVLLDTLAADLLHEPASGGTQVQLGRLSPVLVRQALQPLRAQAPVVAGVLLADGGRKHTVETEGALGAGEGAPAVEAQVRAVGDELEGVDVALAALVGGGDVDEVLFWLVIH